MLCSQRLYARFVLTACAAITLASALAPAAWCTSPSDGLWIRNDPQPVPPPGGRKLAAYAYDSRRGQLLIFGGVGPSGVMMNDLFTEDLTTGTWTGIPSPLPRPSPREDAAGIYDAANDRMIVFGGYDGSDVNDVWTKPLGSSQPWARLATLGTPPINRDGAMAVYDAPRHRMVIFGGFGGGDYLNDTWALTLDATPTWSRIVTAHVPPGRNKAGVAFDGDHRMFLFGGWGVGYMSDTWVLTLDGTPDWTPIATGTGPTGRRELPLVYDPDANSLVVFGGYNGSQLGDLWVLSLQGTPRWSKPLVTPPSSRSGHAAVYDPVGKRSVFFGGQASTGNWNDTWTFVLMPNPAWNALSLPGPQPVPFGGEMDYAVAVDPVANQMLLSGGMGPGAGIASFSLSDPYLAYTTVTPATGPTPRSAPRAVWDAARDRMLVFGGYVFGTSQSVSELWEYRPRPTPTWNLLATSGTPPPPRSGAGLVLDAAGDRLVVFGGQTGGTWSEGSVLGDLWELPLSGPNAMTWAPLAATGTAPSPRYGHTMVMDPKRNRAIVYGGGTDMAYGTPNVFSTTYALDLGTSPPNWSQISPTGFILPPRTMHAAVIDPVGDRMVIFAGYGQGAGLQFRFDVWALPLSGEPQWKLLQTAGTQPTGRYGVSAVYDPAGQRMVFAGGFNAGVPPSGYLADVWSLTWDAATPATASLIDSHAEPGLVRLNWFVTDAASAVVTVQRQHGAETWTTLGAPASTASDRLTFEDRSVVAGGSYRYRLSLREGGSETLTDAVEITVPSGYTLELAGATPNPAIGSNLRVTLSLPRAMPARLDLIDVSGRRVASRDLSGLAPGRQTVALGDGVRLAPGLYVIRLEADGRAFAKKALVVQ